MQLSNLRIGRKLMLSFALVNLVLLALSGIVIKSLGDINTAVSWNVNSYEALERNNDLLAGMVSQESGLRGFLLSNDEEFLDVYKAGRQQVVQDLDTMKRLTADSPAQQRRVDQIRNLADRWRKEVAEDEIQLMGNEATRAQAQGEEASGIGKALMDQLRGVSHDFDAAERALLETRTATRTAATNFAYWSMIAGSLGAIAIAIVLNWLLSLSVSRPVSAMAAAMNTLAAGDNTVAIPGVGRKDEIGEMAGAVQAFKDAAIEQLQLAEDAARNRQQAEEDRAQNEAVRARAAAEQAEAVQRLGDALKDLASGDLTIRLGEGFSEEYAQIKSDFNEAIDKLKQTMLTVVSSTGGDPLRLAGNFGRLRRSVAPHRAAGGQPRRDRRRARRNHGDGQEVGRRGEPRARRGGGRRRRRQAERRRGAPSGRRDGRHRQVRAADQPDHRRDRRNRLPDQSARAERRRRGGPGGRRGTRLCGRRLGSARAGAALRGSRQGDQGPDLTLRPRRSIRASSWSPKPANRSSGSWRRSPRSTAWSATSPLAAQEQATGLQQINAAINQMDQVTQQNASMVEESTAAGHALSQETEQLSGLIGQFQVGQGAGEVMRAQLERAAPHAFRQAAKAPVGAKTEPRVVANNTRNQPARRVRAAAKAAVSVASAEADWEEF